MLPSFSQGASMSKKTKGYQRVDLTDPAALDMLECHREGNLVIPNGKALFLKKLTPAQVKISEKRETLRSFQDLEFFSLSDHLTECAKNPGYEPRLVGKSACRDCGTLLNVDKVEMTTKLVNDDAPDSFYHSTTGHYCRRCLSDRLSGRIWRRWVPLGKPTQIHLDWLEKAKELLSASADLKGRHLLGLLPPGQSFEDADLLLAMDQFPFTHLGTNLSGTDYLDLATLIRCWSRGILCQDCPQCQDRNGFHIFQIGGSLLSGVASWWGFCRNCQSVQKRDSTGYENGLSHWLGEFSKAYKLFGRSLRIKR